MADRFDTYESEFCESAEALGNTLKQSHHDAEMLEQETNEYLSQMDDAMRQLELEVRSMHSGNPNKSEYSGRLGGYRQKLQSFRREVREAIDKTRRDALMGGSDGDLESGASHDHRALLLSTRDRLADTSERISEGHRQLLETEQIGAQVMEDLNTQSETIRRSRRNLGTASDNIVRSRRILGKMMKDIYKNKALLWGIIGLLAFVIIMIIYFKLVRK